MKSKKQEEAIAKREAEAIEAFEEWYPEQGYDEAAASAPFDTEDDGFMGTIAAENLLPDFFEAHPKYVFYEEALREHCYEIGDLFNSEKWNFKSEDDTQQFVGNLYRIHNVREQFKKK